MIICEYCATQNREGQLFCETCGNPIHASAKRIGTRPPIKLPGSDHLTGVLDGAENLPPNRSISFYIRDVAEPITLEPKADIIIGRAVADTPEKPDLDLTPYYGRVLGVSRLHAAMRYYEGSLTIIDLESTHGTFVNGQRLRPDQEKRLGDGDEIRFGSLVAHIYFEKRSH